MAVTAYDYMTARLASEAGVDLILVGDSLGTTILGFSTTVPVTLEMMLHHTAAVARSRPQSLVVTDIPFPEAHRDKGLLLDGAARCLQEGGAEAVKIEGGQIVAEKVRSLVAAGIPVLGHVGLLPQRVHETGGYRKYGKSAAERTSLLEDARAIEDAGAFALVAEMVEASVAGEMRDVLKIPVIGIGSGLECDGQILVSNDLLGLTPGKVPGFVKQYARLDEAVREAFSCFGEEVRKGLFPR